MIVIEIQNAVIDMFNNESLEYKFLKHIFATGVYPKTEDDKYPEWLNFDIIQNIKIKVDMESRTNGFNPDWAYSLFHLLEEGNNWKDYQSLPSSK